MKQSVFLKINKINNKYKNDLLLPIILIFVVFPFIIYLKKYDSGLGKYSWYSSNAKISDFYAYYRSKIFVILSFISSIILLFRFGLYKDRIRNLRIFLGLFLFGLGATISTVFSINLDFSLNGTYYNFETLFVVYGYIIICLYAYQIIQNKEDIQVIIKAMTVMAFIVIVWGGLELFNISPMEQKWFQRLIISKENITMIGKLITIFKNTVVLTFFNPDYTGEYLSMIIPVFFAMVFICKKRYIKIFYSFITIALLILLWFTHYRGGIISLGATALIILPIFFKRIKKVYIIVITIFALIMVCDVAFNVGFVSNIKDTQQNYSMESIKVRSNGIYLETINNTSVIIEIEKNKLKITDSTGKDLTDKYNDKLHILDVDGFKHVGLQVFYDDSITSILLQFDNNEWSFNYNSNTGYTYVNNALKEDVILDPDVFSNSHYDYLGAGRFYIWSRIIPMLKNYIVHGSGPNTFFVVFPQNDYVGKYHTYLTTSIIVDKAHNNYFMIWVQYGLIALIGYVIFYAVYFIKNYKFFYKNDLKDFNTLIGFGFFAGTIIYMINGLFIDSSIFVSPIFWTMLGISMAQVCIVDRNEMFYRNTLRIKRSKR